MGPLRFAGYHLGMRDRKSAPPDPLIDCRPYSRAERISDAIVHIAALVVALGAVPVLITLTAVWRGDAPGITGVSIYGATLVAMLTASLAYNHLPLPHWRSWLLRLDRSAIYLKIAGTYTPFTLLAGAGGALLAVIWVFAILAAIGNLFIPRRTVGLSVAVCLVMGWAVVAGGWGLIAQLSAPVVVLMVVGGLLYTAGTLFLIFDRIRFHNTIWHAFVVAASAVFFVAVFMQAAASV